MALTEIAIRAAKGREKPYKMTDSGGLYLLVQPNGSKYWRQKYRRLGREGKLSIGNYPDVGLREARKRSVAAKEQLAAHKDPVREKQKAIQEAQLLATNTFELVAAEYCERRLSDGHRPWAPSTAKRCAFLLAHLHGSIGRLPVTDIAPIDVLQAVRKLEKRKKLESARRALQVASAVFRYAVATARLSSDPTRDLKGALATPRVTHYAAILDDLIR